MELWPQDKPTKLEIANMFRVDHAKQITNSAFALAQDAFNDMRSFEAEGKIYESNKRKLKLWDDLYALHRSALQHLSDTINDLIGLKVEQNNLRLGQIEVVESALHPPEVK